MESSITTKGQITLPAALRKRFGLEHGQKVMFAETDQGILVKPVEIVNQTKKTCRKKALDESLAQAEAGEGYYFASDAEFIDFLEKESNKSRRGKKSKK